MYIYGKYSSQIILGQNKRQAIKTSRTGYTLKTNLDSNANNCSYKASGPKIWAACFELVKDYILSSMVQTAGGHPRHQPIKQIKYETQDAKITVNYEKKWMKQIVQTELHCISFAEPCNMVVTSRKPFCGYFA